jgi:hypothetical protein
MVADRVIEYGFDRNPHIQDPRNLQRYGFQVNSQNLEDGMIREIFRRIGTSNRVFVEIGVGNGIENNTAFLLAQGWKGFWVDSSSEFLKVTRSRLDLQDGCLTSLVASVCAENAPVLLSELQVPTEFDLLSLDVDQNTFYVWEALHAFHPRVVVVEYNATIPPDLDWMVRYAADRTWDGTQNFGASLKAYEKLGRRLGYSLVGCDFNGVNAFFVQNELTADKFLVPFTAENHYEPPRYVFSRCWGHDKSILDRAMER